jgi:TolB-like protein/Tfp pilus assembly protein PilF
MPDGPDAPVRGSPVDAPAAVPPGADTSEPSANALKARKKRDKVRAAWIAFTGRILAQLIGAIATVGLGLYVVRTYGVERPSRAPATATGTAAASPSAEAAARPVAEAGRLSLVVLPFQAFSPGRADPFSDSFTEALIADLSRLVDLRVISRTSSMYYKGTSKTLPVIARELNVDLVVEGAVMREADRVRVTVQLIDAAADTHLWSGTYDRVTRDVLSLQADVTRAVAQDLHAVITPRQEQAVAVSAGIGQEAVERYLRGRQAFRRRSPGDLADATGHFARVVALASSFAPAHAALANTWCLRALDAFGAPAAREALDKADVAAREALRLDPTSADGHLALAMVRHRRDWDWAGAEREYARVFDLHETHATAHQWYSIFLAEQGRDEQARRHAARAIALDSTAAPVHRTAGLVALYGRRYAEAAASMRRALDLDPSAGVTRLMLASVLIQQGRHAEARQMADGVRDPELQDQRLSLLACAALRTGDRAAAVRYRAEAMALPGVRSLVATARFESVLGQPAALVATAAQAVTARTQLACALKVHPVFDAVRATPDFQALMHRVGLS